MLRVAVIISFLLASCCLANAQKIGYTDFDSIKVQVGNKASKYYYPSLLERFFSPDSVFSEEDYKCLYYGAAFSDYYMQDLYDKEDKILDFFNTARYDTVIVLGDSLIKKTPTNLQLISKMRFAWEQKHNPGQAGFWGKRYDGLVKAITKSGSGKLQNNPYVIMYLDDEYDVLNALGFIYQEQMLIGECDKIVVAPNEKNIDELWFNVSKPLARPEREIKE